MQASYGFLDIILMRIMRAIQVSDHYKASLSNESVTLGLAYFRS